MQDFVNEVLCQVNVTAFRLPAHTAGLPALPLVGNGRVGLKARKLAPWGGLCDFTPPKQIELQSPLQNPN